MATELLEVVDLPGLDPDERHAVTAVHGCRATLRRSVTPQGGIHRDHLLAELAQLDVLTVGAPSATFRSDLLAFTAAGGRMSIAAHGGRAHINNEALLGVLSAAAAPRVRTHVAVVPEVYMHGAAAERVREQLTSLLKQPGINLDLDTVVLLIF